jgi:hypothetical protein
MSQAEAPCGLVARNRQSGTVDPVGRIGVSPLDGPGALVLGVAESSLCDPPAFGHPPQEPQNHLCLDEKTQVQALDRLDLVLPLSPGRLERRGLEYYRLGTLSLPAAFNTRTGARVATAGAPASDGR